MMKKYDKKDIIQIVKNEDVSFIRLQFTDILGKMRNIAITPNRLERALENNCSVDGSMIDGFVDIDASDLYLEPDLNTFEIFPWRPHQGRVARLICDIKNSEHGIFEGDSRYVLKKIIDEATKAGYVLNVGTRCEFFLFNTDDDGNPTLQPHDKAGYFDLAPADNGENCRRDIILTLEEMGFEIEESHHEASPGQHEVDFKYDDVLTTADRIVTFRNVVKTIAKRHGLHATFMPKPMQDAQGSGMHVNMSLMKDGKNVFVDDSGKLSETAYMFIAGLLKYAPDMMCLTNPIVNSYKRLIRGYDAPCYISWSEQYRNSLVRVPKSIYKEETAVELRSPDPSANPYLVLAACLKAGLQGISQKLTPPHQINIEVSKLTQSERDALSIPSVPESLNAAIRIAKQSEFVTELLGVVLKNIYLGLKEKEYDGYRATINQWEIDNYLIQY